MIAIIHPFQHKYSTPGDSLGSRVRTWLADQLNLENTVVYDAVPDFYPLYLKAVINCTRTPDPIPPYVYTHKSIPHVNIYPPQDGLSRFWAPTNEEDEESTDIGNKDLEPTRRVNQIFWADIAISKLLSQLNTSRNNAHTSQTTNRLHEFLPIPSAIRPAYPHIFLNPELSQVNTYLANRLSISAPVDLYLDIETRDERLDCIGFRFDDGPVYVVPIYRYNNQLAHSPKTLYRFWALLAACLNAPNVTIVAHNASYDLAFLGAFYRMPFTHKIYDTMCVTHRIFPQLEKSLAHTIGLWTNFPYHKSEYTLPTCAAAENKLWLYNAKDVAVMREIKLAQLAWAATKKGLLDSINTVNASISPYLTNTLFGLRLNKTAQYKEALALTNTITQTLRIIRTLVAIPDFNPNSSDQCADFFFNTLKYEPYEYSEKTNAPTCDATTLYKLLTRYKNPVIPFIIRYREASKSHSMLSPRLFTIKK